MERWHGRVGAWTAVALLALTAAVLCSSGADARGVLKEPWDGARGAPRGVYALYPPNVFSHNVGLVEAEVTNLGFIGNPYYDGYNFGWRGGEYLYLGGLWIGAIASDNLPHVSTAAYDLELRPPLEPIYNVYQSFEGAPGGNRLGFSAGADDDGDGRVDEDFLNGRDDDGDRKIDEDYEAISQQMYSCEYWDNTQEAVEQNPEHRAMNLRVQQRSFAWSTARSNEFVGVDYRVTNVGQEVLRNVFLGFFVDADAGPKTRPNYWTDDVVGFTQIDTTVVDLSQSGPCAEVPIRMDIAYIYDYPDDGDKYNGGDVPGFFGTLFLGHTIDRFGIKAPREVKIYTMSSFSGDQPYPLGDPNTDLERYDLLSKGELPERGGQVTPRDYRWVISAGPFRELLPDSSLVFQSCFVIGFGYEGMIQNAITAQRIYNGQFKDVDTNPATGVDGRETCLTALPDGSAYEWRDPCDTLGTRINFKNTTCEPDYYVNNDCNDCTGVDGKETLVHWVGTVAPPSPSTNADPEVRIELNRAPEGDQRGDVWWDNSSELRADPILRRIVFEGYRVWRVDGWTRPQGSTGPSPEEWQLIKEFELHPKDGLEDQSPNYLLSVMDTTARAIETVETGDPDRPLAVHYEVGRYKHTDTKGLKNGMIYFYDVTAFSRWKEPVGLPDTTIMETDPPETVITMPDSLEFELGGRPSALEAEAVIPRWSASQSLDEVIVVPNPYVAGRQPLGWDLTPSDSDPTGTRIAFARLPQGKCTIRIFTLAGDLVRSLEHDTRAQGGTAFWNLVTRNGQDVVSGVYLFTVESDKGTKRGRFVIIR
jgi:hypothetical protein